MDPALVSPRAIKDAIRGLGFTARTRAAGREAQDAKRREAEERLTAMRRELIRITSYNVCYTKLLRFRTAGTPLPAGLFRRREMW